MKKILIVFVIILFVICGCKDKKNNSDSKDVVLTKINDDKKDIYLEEYKAYLLANDEEFKQMIPIINYSTDDVNNFNLEIKSKLNINYKKGVINEGKYEKIYFSEYELNSNDMVNSLLSINYLYYNGEKDVVSVDVYNFLKKDYSLLSNEDILEMFDMSEQEMFNKILDSNDNDDSEYMVMLIKNNGYVLGVENNKMVLYYVVNDDNDSELKKMVL